MVKKDGAGLPPLDFFLFRICSARIENVCRQIHDRSGTDGGPP